MESHRDNLLHMPKFVDAWISKFLKENNLVVRPPKAMEPLVIYLLFPQHF